MKKMMITLTALLTLAMTANAMSYEQARNEALFLTDKMAYELNLTDAQYEAAYEINLDYLMGVTSYDDVYSTYWERRNLDMSYILLDWQWQAFINATYFYRPLYWSDGFWHFGIYARYPHRDYFYFGRPVFYASYRGGHAWHAHGGRGYYYNHSSHYRPSPTPGRTHFGMLDRWNRGDFRHHHSAGRTSDRNFGGSRNSSTRYTGSTPHSLGGRNSRNIGSTSSSGSFGGYRDRNSRLNRNTTSNRNSDPMYNLNNSSSRSNRQSGGSFSGSRSHSSSSYSGGISFSGSHSNGSFSGGSRSGSSFGGSRSSGSFSGGSRSGGSFSGSRSGGSFGGSRSSGSFSGGGGGHSASGGRSFGGHR